jgi:hypothetical protein
MSQLNAIGSLNLKLEFTFSKPGRIGASEKNMTDGKFTWRQIHVIPAFNCDQAFIHHSTIYQ